MNNRSFYNEILTEHNIRPEYKYEIEEPDIRLEGVNPNCGDDIWLNLKLDGDIIADGGTIGTYSVKITRETNKTTYTFTKLLPYQYTITTSDEQPISFDSGYENNWYVLSNNLNVLHKQLVTYSFF